MPTPRADGSWSRLPATSPEQELVQPQEESDSSTLADVLPDVSWAQEELDSFSLGDVPPDVSTRRAMKAAVLCFMPIVLAIAPVAAPFGDPFGSATLREDCAVVNATNATARSPSAIEGCRSPLMDRDAFLFNTRENWAYFFWYTPVGWAQLWITMALWNHGCMKADPASKGVSIDELFACYPMLIVGPTIFTCLIFTGSAYFIFPFPLGTFSLGIPCFGCFFAFCVGLARGKHRVSLKLLLELCGFWTMWVFGMFFFVKLTQLNANPHKSSLLHVGVPFGFFVAPYAASFTVDIATRDLAKTSVRKFGASPPFQLWFNHSLSIYKSFILPVVGEPLGFVCVQGALFLVERVTVFAIVHASHREISGQTKRWPILWRLLCPAEQDEIKKRTEQLVLNQITEMLAPLHFSAVLLFNCLGPNAGCFYHLDKLSETKLRSVIMLMTGNILFQLCSTVLTFYELYTGLVEQCDDESAGRPFLEALRKHRREDWTLDSSSLRENWTHAADDDDYCDKSQLVQVLCGETSYDLVGLTELSDRVITEVLAFRSVQAASAIDVAEDSNPVEYTGHDPQARIWSARGGRQQRGDAKAICFHDCAEWLATKESPKHFLRRMTWFTIEVEWLRLTWMTAAIVTVAGSCMNLKHDGMDLSFDFQWLPAPAVRRLYSVFHSFASATLFPL